MMMSRLDRTPTLKQDPEPKLNHDWPSGSNQTNWNNLVTYISPPSNSIIFPRRVSSWAPGPDNEPMGGCGDRLAGSILRHAFTAVSNNGRPRRAPHPGFRNVYFMQTCRNPE